MPANTYIHALTNLRTGRVGSHERPHKPALLLAIISMIETGRLERNEITYNPELFELFREFFDVVKAADDSVNMLDPFWRLKTDGLLEHHATPAHEAVVAQATPPSANQLQEVIRHSALPIDLFQELKDPVTREQFRRAIIGRYFAGKEQELQAVVQREREIGIREQLLDDAPSGNELPVVDEYIRDQAFRRVVLRAYDYRCAACGLRVVIDDLVLVEAAHLIPWADSHDDDPRNGMALCKNHHWAMDRWLIAPTTRHDWLVSKVLDDRIEGQRDLIDLRGRSILLPRESRHSPKPDALQWRENKLMSA